MYVLWTLLKTIRPDMNKNKVNIHDVSGRYGGIVAVLEA